MIQWTAAVNELLSQIISSVEPACVSSAAAAIRNLYRPPLEMSHESDLPEWAARLAAARHSVHPDIRRITVLVIASDHGCELESSAEALRHIADGTGSISTAARGANAQLMLVDSGIRSSQSTDLGRGVLEFRIGNGTNDFRLTPAMSQQQAEEGIQTGVALLYSLADKGLDLLCLAQVRPKILCCDAIHTSLAAKTPPIEVLQQVGGFEIAVMTGCILAAASVHIPIVLGDAATAAAALASQLCPNVFDYLLAAQPNRIDLKPILLTEGNIDAPVRALPLLQDAVRAIMEPGTVP